MRYTQAHIPNKTAPCPMTRCVYNQSGLCDDPRTNRGNGDAACHSRTIKWLLEKMNWSQAICKNCHGVITYHTHNLFGWRHKADSSTDGASFKPNGEICDRAEPTRAKPGYR